MLQLKQIVQTRPKRVCYCGRPLVGEFCHEHGTDIRVDTVNVDAQLQFQSDQSETPFSDLVVDVSLPENQFFQMFNQTQSQIPTETLGEVYYELCVPSGQGEELLGDLLDLSEVIPFFGDKYIIKTDRLKWRSVVLLYYLVNYRIISNKEYDTIFLTYSAIPLRKVSNYITWRFTQCQASPYAVQWSLLNSHSKVYLNNGVTGRITGVEWETDQQLPSTLIFQADTNGSKTPKTPTQLYQGCRHFVIGQNQQYKARMALEEISYQFTQAVVQFLQMKSKVINVRRLTKTTQQYRQLIGSEVRLRFEQLRLIGELQQKKMTMNHLQPLLNRSSGSPRKLLVVSCSATKLRTVEDLPAILRYSGYTYILLKAILLSRKWPADVDLLIVSAKYGLLQSQTQIPYYNQPITSQIIQELQQFIQTQVEELDLSSYTESFMNLSRLYFQSIADLYSALTEQGCEVIRFENHGLTRRNNLMLEWLA